MSDVKVILDVEIGHSVCPEDETEETCKLNKVSEAIQQELLKARIDELEHIEDKHKVRLWFDGFYGVDDRITDLQAKLKGTNNE